MIDETQKKAIELEMDRMVLRLTEMGCDSVSVFATMRIDRRTDTLCTFDGNYYARVGLVQDWLNHERDIEVVEAVTVEDDDSDEGWKDLA
jgi:hypothetical protein